MEPAEPKITTEKVELSPTLKTNPEEIEFHRHLTLGIEEKLKKNRMIREIKLIIRKPAEKCAITSWERKHGVNLPNDFKDYYMSTNGFKLTWALDYAGDLLRIGEMNINSLNQLIQIESNYNSFSNTEARVNTSSKPVMNRSFSAAGRQGQGESQKSDSTYPQISFAEMQLMGMSKDNFISTGKLAPGLSLGSQGKAFVLDSGRSGWGRVCLVYPNINQVQTSDIETVNSAQEVDPPIIRSSTKSCDSDLTKSSNSSAPPGGQVQKSLPQVPTVEIWFMDPSFQWHYLAPTFTHYYRMLLIHLGLPQWQYRFTPFGLSAWAEQMFWLVAPHLLQPPKISKFPSLYHGGGLWSAEVPAEAAAPNSTNNVLSNQIFRRKKKDKPQQ